MELPNGHLDELAGGGVDELVELLLPPVPGEHDPTPGVEAGRSPWPRVSVEQEGTQLRSGCSRPHRW
jgi:hypothetical protein